MLTPLCTAPTPPPLRSTRCDGTRAAKSSTASFQVIVFHQRYRCAPSVQPIYDEENPARQGVSHLSAPDEGGEGGRLQVEHHLRLSLLRFYFHHRTLSM